jgi:hypothetical protein
MLKKVTLHFMIAENRHPYMYTCAALSICTDLSLSYPFVFFMMPDNRKLERKTKKVKKARRSFAYQTLTCCIFEPYAGQVVCQVDKGSNIGCTVWVSCFL